MCRWMWAFLALAAGCGESAPPAPPPVLPTTLPARFIDPAGSGDFRFVVLGGGWSWRTPAEAPPDSPGLRAALDLARRLDPDFAVLLGGLVPGGAGDRDALARRWDAFDALLDALRLPRLALPGGSDLQDETAADVWLRRYGPDYFSWEHKQCRFLALNSEAPGQAGRVAGEQQDWLEDDLMRAGLARRIFVFVHRPLWRGPPGAAETDAWFRDVHPLLAAARVDTVFAGRGPPDAEPMLRDGVRYLVVGSADAGGTGAGGTRAAGTGAGGAAEARPGAAGAAGAGAGAAGAAGAGAGGAADAAAGAVLEVRVEGRAATIRRVGAAP